jgi:ATP/maltotriose-dependent transcriptional regulator MalT
VVSDKQLERDEVMPDGCYSERGGQAAFPFCGSHAPALLQDIQQGLLRAWHLTLASQIDEALTALEAVERQLDGLPPPGATRYRAASHLVRSAVLAFQDDSLAVLAIVVSHVLVERGAGLGVLLTEAYGRTETYEPASAPRAVNGTRPPAIDSDAITARERDVLSRIGQGYSNKRIARTLEISPETVKSHVKHIFLKLEVTTRSEAVSRAASLGLL